MARPAAPPHDPNLGPRLERFRTNLAVAGGPVQTLDQGRAGLDDLWRWFVESAPWKPGQLYDETALREAGPLPAWYPREDVVARSLGPQLLQLTDGLAAHVTTILIAGEPEAEWVIAKDGYISGDVPKLRLPGRRPGAVDERIAVFVYRARKDVPPAFYLPNDPMDFVDAFLEFGDPPPRSYNAQTAKEAKALLELVATGHDARLARFLDTVATRGGPRDGLDFSRQSLVPLWTWLTSLALPPSPVPDREMRLSAPPWWYEFSGIMIGQVLGPDLCWLATGAADYAAEVVFRVLPDSAWVLGAERRGVDFREPLLRVGAVHTFDIHDRVARRLADPVVEKMPFMSGHSKHPITPDDLRDLIDTYLGYARQPVPTEAGVGSEPDYFVDHPTPRPTSLLGRVRGRLGLIDEGGNASSATISFSDEVAHGQSGRVDRLVRGLAKHDGVDRAFREDRELVYVLAPRMAPDELSDLIDRCWAEAAPAVKTAKPG